MVDALISKALDNPRALAILGQMLLHRGEDARARSLALQARALAPRDAEIAVLTAEILNADVPQWHFSIVRDEARNAAFDLCAGLCGQECACSKSDQEQGSWP
jgi:hypothetical protein